MTKEKEQEAIKDIDKICHVIRAEGSITIGRGSEYHKSLMAMRDQNEKNTL